MTASGLPADRGDVAPGLGDRLPAALDRVGLAIARRHVGRQGEALRPVLDAHDRGVAARHLHRVAEDEMVVLLPDPALRAQVGRADERLQRLGVRHRRRDALRRQHRLEGVGEMRPVVDRRLVAELLDRQIRHRLAAVPDDEAQRVGGLADDREIEPPFAEDRLRLRLHAGLQHHEHALLALGEHHLVGASCPPRGRAPCRGRARRRGRPWRPSRPPSRSGRRRPCPGSRSRRPTSSARGRPRAGASRRRGRRPARSGASPPKRRRTRPTPWWRRGCRRGRSWSRDRRSGSRRRTPPRRRSRPSWRGRPPWR